MARDRLRFLYLLPGGLRPGPQGCLCFTAGARVFLTGVHTLFLNGFIRRAGRPSPLDLVMLYEELSTNL